MEQQLETDPVKLLVRWQGIGKPLCDLEREILLIELWEENFRTGGEIHRNANSEIEKLIAEGSDKCRNYSVQ